MQGEEINASFVTERGLFGDRAYALMDAEDGKTVTAKNPKKWPAMFAFRAAFLEPATWTRRRSRPCGSPAGRARC